MPHYNQSRWRTDITTIMRLRSGLTYSLPCVQSQSKKRRRSFRRSRKVMVRLRLQSTPVAVGTASPVIRNMFRSVNSLAPWGTTTDLVEKPRFTGVGKLRHWAREGLSRTFVLTSSEVDPSQNSAGQAESATPSDGLVSNSGEIKDRSDGRSLLAMVGTPGVRKKFLKVSRTLLQDLGLSLVGPLPLRALEIMWQYFGEEHFSAHGRACWCRLCRSVGPARFSFLQGIGDMLFDYFVSFKSVACAIFSLIAPAPLRMAKFVANKLWKWFNVIWYE